MDNGLHRSKAAVLTKLIMDDAGQNNRLPSVTHPARDRHRGQKCVCSQSNLYVGNLSVQLCIHFKQSLG